MIAYTRTNVLIRICDRNKLNIFELFQNVLSEDADSDAESMNQTLQCCARG